MKLKYLSIVVFFALMSCASGSGNEKAGATEVNEEAIVDSISTSMDKIKTEISTETEKTVEEIDELLKDI